MIDVSEILNRLFIFPFDYGIVFGDAFVPSIYDSVAWYFIFGLCFIFIYKAISKFLRG